MVCEHEYMNMISLPIIELAMALLHNMNAEKNQNHVYQEIT
jgi:hypothetical protein